MSASKSQIDRHHRLIARFLDQGAVVVLTGAGFKDAYIQYQKDMVKGTEYLHLRVPYNSGDKAVAALKPAR